MAAGLVAQSALPPCIALVATAHGTTSGDHHGRQSGRRRQLHAARGHHRREHRHGRLCLSAPGSGADVVMVAPGTHTLTLVGAGEDVTATGDLDVTADLEIGGGAEAATVDGSPLHHHHQAMAVKPAFPQQVLQDPAQAPFLRQQTVRDGTMHRRALQRRHRQRTVHEAFRGRAAARTRAGAGDTRRGGAPSARRRCRGTLRPCRRAAGRSAS